MRLKYLYILFFAVVQLSFSQDKKFDSIKKLVETYTERDSVRVELLNQLTKYYTSREISKNELILNEAIEISEAINYKQGIIDSNVNLISFYVNIGSFDKALELALETTKMQQKRNDIDGLISTNSLLARIYNHLSKPKKAIQIQLNNLELLKNKPLSGLKASIHFYLATAYTENEEFNKSEFHYKEAKNIAEKTGFETGVTIANSSLGILEGKRGNYKLAVDYLNSTMDFYKKNNQKLNIAHTNLELAVVYAKDGQVNKAISINEVAIKIYEEQKNYKNLFRTYLNQSNFYQKKDDFKNTNKFLNEHYRIKDSIFSKEKQEVIQEMQVKYETEKSKRQKEAAEQQVVLSKLENQKNKNRLLWTGIIAGLILVSSLFYFVRLKTKKKSELINLELVETQKRLVLEKEYRKSELKALRSQMNPHFIFNALTSIQDYIIQNEQKLARKYLVKFSRLIRIYLEHSQIDTVSVQDEITALELYLDLEKDRFEDSFTYSIHLDDTIDWEQIEIPTFLTQPYVENAIKHGLLHKKSSRELKVSFSLNKEKSILKCSIEDNGIGREASAKINEKRIKPKSFSSDTNQKRIELLNKTRDQPISLTINDNYNEMNIATGTNVFLTIPI